MVITAVGMVNHLPVMMAAVVIAMILMLLASKPLTRFVNQHPTVVVLPQPSSPANGSPCRRR
jgi:predicted tellurium resistance membrane protein TerC